MTDVISDSALITALRRQMTVATARVAAASGNLANYETPGYKTKEVSFDQALGDKLLPVNATNSRHLGSAATSGVTFREVDGLADRRDGNNVQLDREMLANLQASGDYASAQTALAAKFRLVRYALNESR